MGRPVIRASFCSSLPLGTRHTNCSKSSGKSISTSAFDTQARPLLTGDTLFPGGPGYSRDHAALLQEILSITGKLYVLPDETLVLPGHGDGTTIGASRAEHAVFASREHAPDLHGDVLWASS